MLPTAVGGPNTKRVGVIRNSPPIPQRRMPHSKVLLAALLESACSIRSLAGARYLHGSGSPGRACTSPTPAAANVWLSFNSAAAFSRRKFGAVAAIMGPHPRLGAHCIVQTQPGCRQSPSACPCSYASTVIYHLFLYSNSAVRHSYRGSVRRRGWSGLSPYSWGAGPPSPHSSPHVMGAGQQAPAPMSVSVSASAASPATTAAIATTTAIATRYADTAAPRSNTAPTSNGGSTLGPSKNEAEDNGDPGGRSLNDSSSEGVRSNGEVVNNGSTSENSCTGASPSCGNDSRSGDCSSRSSSGNSNNSNAASRRANGSGVIWSSEGASRHPDVTEAEDPGSAGRVRGHLYEPGVSAAAYSDVETAAVAAAAAAAAIAAAGPQTNVTASWTPAHRALDAQEDHPHPQHHPHNLHHHQHHHHQQGPGSPQLPPPHSAVEGSWWRREGPGLCPAPGRLQIWWAPLDAGSTCSPTRVARYGECLSVAEAMEVAGSQDPEIAARRTAARALVRCVLARAVGEGAEHLPPQQPPSAAAATHTGGWPHVPADAAVPPKNLEFHRNAYGKPHLLTRPGWPLLHHNLTHTNDLAELSDAEERARRFVWLWTLKEAYVKARGTGISAPPGLRGFAIGFEDMTSARVQKLKAACGGTYSFAASPKTITLQHTDPGAGSGSDGAAASLVGGPALNMGSDGMYDSGCTSGGDCLFEGPQTHFHFLLLQPTPRHVGALCVAVHPAAAAIPFPARPASGPRSRELVSSDCPSALSLATALSEEERGGNNPGLCHGGLEDHLAALVEYWWCEPLGMEGRLSGAELTLLGAS
ncbi:hypothetical protein Vretimale_5436 [Volvox reticuliferus]|uniref:holo-[acyl-carrier-protein] synthase n=1 Tax=Volvox reticuliferus TaxID=1737510 RepID=A0A8J4G592_9CHLO|nr:hypothetical protein Vretimale_5436 [Volvox reticuliferus]